jgi:hypothetical protein
MHITDRSMPGPPFYRAHVPQGTNMNMQDAALAMAGVIGSGTAIVHGILTQRHMVSPIEAVLLTEKRVSTPIRRLVSVLLHFSTYAWFLGGLALIAAAIWLGDEARRVTGLFVGSLYLFGAAGNFWATRGRHPGWMLMAVAVVLIGLGIS